MGWIVRLLATPKLTRNQQVPFGHRRRSKKNIAQSDKTVSDLLRISAGEPHARRCFEGEKLALSWTQVCGTRIVNFGA